ncbi:hypothetical protein [Bradyrhizobium roseum]|uniref:hypothetical protein n=1 Tax=Bradyrhizobium roseum TaxID=3056648 RepID=UPI0026078986|nr:hypothetical protein [Bradyrhizobium roseus]WKA29332.1 hypothetical protein QUH67_03835 [Bradyrhizobium roseus]
MFGPQHLKYLITYFDGVDKALAKKLARKHPPDEPALTNELCALLDAETQRAEPTLEYSLDQLNRDLAAVGDGLDFEITLDTHPHNMAMERYVSQSDFGLVLEYDNRVLPQENWSKAYLVQAKRLFRNPQSGEYDHKSRFQALNSDQSARLTRLAEILGRNALYYAFYCPLASALSETARTQVRALHTRNLSRKLYDGSTGLALRDAVAVNGGIDAGIWMHQLASPPTLLPQLHVGAFNQAWPLTWFLVDRFSGYDDLYGDDESYDQERVRRIVAGDMVAIRELIEELSKAGEEDVAPSTITVLPRHTISIKVTVGKSLPSDLAGIQVD